MVGVTTEAEGICTNRSSQGTDHVDTLEGSLTGTHAAVLGHEVDCLGMVNLHRSKKGINKSKVMIRSVIPLKIESMIFEPWHL